MQPISKLQGWSPRAGEPPTTPQFFELAGEEKNLTQLILLFQSAMTIVDAKDHHCSRLVMHHHVVPLFGNAPGHAARIAGEAKVRKHALATRPGIISPPDPAGQALMIVPVLLPMSDPLIVSIGIDERISGELDRSTRARVNGYATIYAMKAHPLWEIEEDIETATPLTLKERIGLAMMLSGRTRFEIAEHLHCSIQAVERHLTNATHKLGTRDEVAAVALAARRGWLHLPQNIDELIKMNR